MQQSMVKASLNRWPRAAFALVGAGILFSPHGARAACGAPPLAVLWSYPADGDANVPMDADFLLVPADPQATVRVELDGKLLEDRGELVPTYDLGQLPPHTAHTLTVFLEDADDEDRSERVDVHFETGERPAATPPTELGIDGVEWRELEDLSQIPPDPCAELRGRGGCFDALPVSSVTVRPSAEEDPLLWVIEFVDDAGYREYRPVAGSCGVPEAWTYSPDREVWLHAVGQNGDAVRSDSASSFSARNSRAEGCSASGDVGGPGWVAGLALAGWLVSPVRRRRRA